MKRIPKSVEYLWFGALVLAPIVLWILPSTFFDTLGKDVCLSKLLLDTECFACGMTRAIMHFHHFEFSDAVYYNVGVFVAYPVLVIIWLIFMKASMQNLNIGLAKYIPLKTNRDYKEQKLRKIES